MKSKPNTASTVSTLSSALGGTMVNSGLCRVISPICRLSVVPILPSMVPGMFALTATESAMARMPSVSAMLSETKLVPAPVSNMKRYVLPLAVTGTYMVVPRQPLLSICAGSFTGSISMGTVTSLSGLVIVGAGMSRNLS